MQSEYMFQLLKQMKDGDQQAFHAMYDATYQDVYRTVSFLVDHPQDREDVMNEIYMQMWTSLANYDTNRPFHFWLHGLVIRQALAEIPNFRAHSCLRPGRVALGSTFGVNGRDEPNDIAGHPQTDG